jgi:glutamate/tyrosine decarboxylase-like PLP-dependent enzyme
MRDLLEETADRAARYLEGLRERKVPPLPDADQALRSLDSHIPEQPSDPQSVIRMLDEYGSPATMAMAGPRFFGFVIGGSLPAALAANWLAGAWDQNSAFAKVTPATSLLEDIALRWLVELFGLPAGCAGAFVTGTTVAHITALAAARHAVLARAGWNVEADGLFGAPPITVVVGEEAHPTLFKALGVIGLGRKRVIRIPVDDQGRVRPAQIPSITGPAIICTQAGNVNTGACDPHREIIEIARSADAWVHVDGAFGLWAAVSPSLANLVEGAAEADSWATDAHKWLNVPYDSGLAFVRDPNALRAAMSVTAEYLPPAEEQRNPSDYTPELSRRARGVEVWAALRSLGKSGLAEMIERNCRQARRFAEGLAQAGFQVLNEVALNQVLVSFGDGDKTRRVVERLQAEGTCWCGITIWQRKTAMRISVSNWSTTDEDVERCLEVMVRIAGVEAEKSANNDPGG